MIKKCCHYSLLVLLMLLNTTYAVAYDDQVTHPALTTRSITPQIDQYFKSYLGFQLGKQSELSSSNTKLSIQDWLKTGSTAEDSPACRAANHFHDPLKPWWQSGMSDEPLWLDIKCAFWLPKFSNITWATGYLSPPPGGGVRGH